MGVQKPAPLPLEGAQRRTALLLSQTEQVVRPKEQCSVKVWTELQVTDLEISQVCSKPFWRRDQKGIQSIQKAFFSSSTDKGQIQ